MENNQKGTSQLSANTANNGGLMGGLSSSLNNVVGSLRNGSTSVVNTVSGMSTTKKVLAIAALAFGARMLQSRMKR